MVKKTKLIKGVKDDSWRQFKAYCIIHKLNMGDMFNTILDEFLDKVRKEEKKE